MTFNDSLLQDRSDDQAKTQVTKYVKAKAECYDMAIKVVIFDIKIRNLQKKMKQRLRVNELRQESYG